MSQIETAIKWMEDTANDDSHGYDQINRWGPDYDCSSAVITAWQMAGVPVKSRGATYTGNMYGVFKKCGFEDVTSSMFVQNIHVPTVNYVYGIGGRDTTADQIESVYNDLSEIVQTGNIGNPYRYLGLRKGDAK